MKSAVKNSCFDNQHIDFQKRAKGHVLLELVYQHLELIEKDYFGLQFSDNGMPPTTENSDVMVRHCFRKHHLTC
jgi:FERM N-terminal domain.